MSSSENSQTSFAGAQRVALIVAVVGLVLCATSLGNRSGLLQSYLLAYIYWLALTLGSFSLLLLQYVTGGRWGLTIRRLLEAAVRNLPLMALLFVPIFLGAHHIYSWADAAIAAKDELIQKKIAYLNVPNWGIRAVVYFALWILISTKLVRIGRQHDQTADPALADRLRRIAAPGLVIYALTASFASFDWGMSLEPHWFSTMYGVIFAAGGALGAISLATVVLSRIGDRAPFKTFLKGETVGDLGNLTLAFTMFWTYVSLSQLLIIWSGHLPEETPWYVVRFHGGWQFVGIALLLLQFALTFLFLLFRDRKRNLRRLWRVSLFVLFMRFVDIFWIIKPAMAPKGFHLALSDLGALAGIGGIWLWFYFRSLGSAPLMPVKLAEADEGGSHHG